MLKKIEKSRVFVKIWKKSYNPRPIIIIIIITI